MVLQEPFHLSYPHIFEDDGQIYMIPETSNAKQIRLYRCIEFPLKWVLDTVLVSDIVAADTTLCRVDKDDYYLITREWLFASIYDSSRSAVYHSSKLRGPWTKIHQGNLDEGAFSRPAGNVFRDGDSFCRPVQECAPYYGTAIRINQIQLSSNTFSEHSVKKLESKDFPDVTRIHTFNFNDNIVVIDGFVRTDK